MDGSTLRLVTIFCHAIAVTLLLMVWLWFSDLISIQGPQPNSSSKSEQVIPWQMGVAY